MGSLEQQFAITLELAGHLRRYPSEEEGLVFTAERGGVIRRPAFGRLVWRPAVARAGLQGFRFGQLRHTGATLALEAGTNPASSRSGWVTLGTVAADGKTIIDQSVKR